MVSKQGVEETLEGQTFAGNQPEETAAISTVVATTVNARIGAAMDEWFRGLQTAPTILNPAFSPPYVIHALPPKTSEPTHLVQKEPTNSSLPPLPSSATINATHAPLHVLPFTFVKPPPLLPTKLYALPSIDFVPNPSYHPGVGYPQIYSTFEVGESSTHSNPNVPISSSSNIAHQQLEKLR